MSLHSLWCFSFFEQDLSSTFSFLTTPPFPHLLIYWWTTAMHFLLHPLYRCISNQIIFFSGPKQRTFLFLLSSLVHTTFLPFILPQFVLLSGYFTFFIIRLHKRIFLKPSLSPPLLSPSFHPPPSQFFFSLISPQPSLPIACDEERYTLSSSLHKWREEGVRTEGGREEEEERWWWWRAAGKDPFSKRYLFICFPSTFHCYLGGRKKRGDSEKKEKKKTTYTCSLTHTYWERAQMAITHKGNLSRTTHQSIHHVKTRQPPPKQTTTAKGRFVSLPGRKSTALPSKCHPKWASNGLTCSLRAAAFIWNSTVPRKNFPTPRLGRQLRPWYPSGMFFFS